MEINLGAFLNALGILIGALFGLALPSALSLRTQLYFRNAIGLFNFLFGVGLVYLSINGTFWSCLKEGFVALCAVVLGFWIGKFFRFQKMSNYLGRLGGSAIAAAQKNPAQKASDGFNACAILFCAAPLGLIGAVTDGLSDYYYFLAVKAVMDALAMSGLVRLLRWPSALSAVPVFIFFSAVSMAVEFYVKPYLSPQGLNSINITAGLLACIVTIVIFEIRKVELANYLPALAVAPLLAKLLL